MSLSINSPNSPQLGLRTIATSNSIGESFVDEIPESHY